MSIVRRMFTLALALCVLSSVTLPALADEWDLSDGNITIDFQTNPETAAVQQYVTQTAEKQGFDSNPLIYSSTDVTNHTITVDTSASDGAAAQFTIQNVNIEVDQYTNGIDFQAGSEAVMTVSGSNSVNNVQTGSATGTAAAIHVGDQANVTIQGDGNGNNHLAANDATSDSSTCGAGIGTNGADSASTAEDFTATLTITGDVTVDANGAHYGAGIGSGKNGDFSGELIVTDGANVIGDSGESGAAVGSGGKGNFTQDGKISVTDASLTGTSYDNGAGIGSGREGNFAGTLEFVNANITARAGYTGTSGNNWGFGGNGAGIGAGFNGDVTETAVISIKNSTVEAAALNDGAAIGAGGIESNKESQQAIFAGKLIIDNSTVNASNGSQGIPIGAPGATWKNETLGVFADTASIEITGNSTVNLYHGKQTELGDTALIGSNGTNSGTVTIEDTSKVNAWTGNLVVSKGETLITGDRDSYKDAFKRDGKLNPVPMTEEGLGIIAPGVKTEIVIVPKASASSSEGQIDFFWAGIEMQIRAAKKGDTVIIEAGKRTSIPNRIVELAQECGVTLIIKWDGGEDLTIAPEAELTLEGNPILFEILAALLAK